MKELTSRNKQCRREIDSTLRAEASRPSATSSKSYLSTLLSKGFSNTEELIKKMPVVYSVTHTVDCLVALCDRQWGVLTSESCDNREEMQKNVAAMFFETFDHLLRERSKHTYHY
jgi:hypothetical protein